MIPLNAADSEGESSGRQADGLPRLGPAARRLLEENGLSVSDVKGTGPLGIVTKGDVLAAVAKGDKPPGASKQVAFCCSRRALCFQRHARL